MSIVDQASARGATYADLRHDNKRVYTVIRENGKTNSTEVQINEGFCLRCLVNGSWGTGMVTSESDLPSLLDRVMKSARAQTRKNEVTVKETEAGTVTVEKKARKRVVDEDVTEFLASMEDRAYEQSRRISSLSISLIAFERFIHISTSEGRRVTTRIDRIYLRASMTCKEGASIESRAQTWGGVGGMEYLLANENHIMETTAQLAREADILVEAEHSPSSVMDCVLSNTLTGTLLHEACGHAVEADLVVSNESILAGRIGERVAADCITMRDDPTQELMGFSPYDHEGVAARPTTVIREGILKSYLHSRETAALLDAPLTGHCKAEYFSRTPIVRQGNTLLDPGEYALSELLDVRDGLFLGDSAGGQVNVGEGTFSFGTQYTREIAHGELGKYLRGCSLSGNILETMKKVDAVGKEVDVASGGCGKGQMDYQGRLVPKIRLREVMIGGRGR
ncbi:MAG: TldD/PmbA family protein [Theionarchaea archaeon]|nr:TldD/PmbA family protein [Theionarchaea archaeon]